MTQRFIRLPRRQHPRAAALLLLRLLLSIHSNPPNLLPATANLARTRHLREHLMRSSLTMIRRTGLLGSGLSVETAGRQEDGTIVISMALDMSRRRESSMGG
ncbi:hypothetical protein V8F06_002734 [Rhypophila decipiens]